ncbi:uncharacterized protein [Paramormyrops kingsleyae]|uniref:uncharacterized protein isoform X2 n=1 Tax=Paramormyrops kingsleyae TaxID=1676925 RepID=UPI003B97A619
MDLLQQNHQDLRQWLKQNKEVLCQQLSDVAFTIIDKAEGILTVREYKTLIGVTDDSVRIRNLLNTIIRKSSEECKEFVQIMQQHCPLITKLLQSSSQEQCYQFVCAEEGSNVVAPLVSHINTGPFNMDVTLRTPTDLKASDQLDAQKSQNNSACGQTAPPYSVQVQPGITSSVRAIRGSNVFAPVFNHANVSDGVSVNIKMESGSSEAQGLPKKTPEWFIKDNYKKFQGSPKSAEEWAASIPSQWLYLTDHADPHNVLIYTNILLTDNVFFLFLFSDKWEFLKAHISKLVKNVKNVDRIVDELIETGLLHSEMASNIRAQPTAEKKMREIIFGVGSEKMANVVVLALYRCQGDVMEELLPPLEA